MTVAREEAISALTGFHVRPLFCLNWNLEIWETQPMYGTEPESKAGHICGRPAF